ncbi:unnamed protein product [Callosobruchus maculatus]|uniref:Prokaryotic-type class I peptide chain release factors domain-containing protein n=1 Tax=Callosobruchus maculatus TaxID=64391 RepID=A0A653BLA6_CALMS|nr:unnamed protein product [Callosobruchus maculatus]
MVPKLLDKDVEETHVRGWGPGGSNVSKTANCVVLKHLPTGIVVKCHETRYLLENRKRARAHLITKLDNLINGEQSVEAQMKALEKRKSASREEKSEKKRKLKEMWKSREGVE